VVVVVVSAAVVPDAASEATAFQFR